MNPKPSLLQGNVAFMHCNDGDPLTKVPVLVTACLDRIDIKHPVTLNLGTDLQLRGQVSWTSKSSVQIDIDLVSKEDAATANPTSTVMLSASMVFVHVQNGRAAPVNQVKPKTEAEQQRFQAGQAANQSRKQERVNSLTISAPTSDESAKLHQAMMSGFGDSSFALQSTRMEAVELMQPQERNRAGKIFGGFLMHEAYELAYTTAASFAALSSAGTGTMAAPTVIAVDDITFAKPVSIGDVVIFDATVCYSGSNELQLQGAHGAGALPFPESISSIFQVCVSTNILDLKTGKRSLANEFHFTFISRDPAAQPKFPVHPIPVAPIKPTSYHDGMIWLSGRRRMLEALEVLTLNPFPPPPYLALYIYLALACWLNFLQI
jgi:acyl-CoA hydrolase